MTYKFLQTAGLGKSPEEEFELKFLTVTKTLNLSLSTTFLIQGTKFQYFYVFLLIRESFYYINKKTHILIQEYQWGKFFQETFIL